MVDARGGKAGGTSGGGGGSLAGYATQAWVNEGFVSIDFFNRLFTVYGPGETSSDPDVVIEPNDLDSTIKNIKAMFGLWTEQYLSALGLNPGGTGSATSLSMLDDVDITSPANGQALVYNSTSLKWENQTISTVTALANLTDVLLTSPAANQVLVYDGTQWVNSSVKTVNGYSIFGTGDIPASGGGTGNYLPLAGGTMTGTINCTFPSGTAILFSGGEKMNTSGNMILGSNSGAWGVFKNNLTPLIYAVKSNGFVGIGTNNPGYTLDVNGGIGTSEITLKKSTGTVIYAREVDLIQYYYGQYIQIGYGTTNSGWDTYIGGYNIHLRSGSNNELITLTNSGTVGIGTTAPTDKLHVEGYMRAQAIELYYSTPFIDFHYNNSSSDFTSRIIENSSGTLTFQCNIYSTKSITALSDIRQKKIKEYMQLGIDDVANAPIIKFTWKDPKAEDKGLQVGSIAQYWEKVLPEAVKKDKEGTLSMSYGVVALVAAVSTAKKVQEHERRIAELERENKDLKGRLLRLNRYGKQ